LQNIGEPEDFDIKLKHKEINNTWRHFNVSRVGLGLHEKIEYVCLQNQIISTIIYKGKW